VTGEHESLRGGTKTDSKNLVGDPKNLISKMLTAFGDPFGSPCTESAARNIAGIRRMRIHRAIEIRDSASSRNDSRRGNALLLAFRENSLASCGPNRVECSRSVRTIRALDERTRQMTEPFLESRLFSVLQRATKARLDAWAALTEIGLNCQQL